jgi:hypothetical protein
VKKKLPGDLWTAAFFGHGSKRVWGKISMTGETMKSLAYLQVARQRRVGVEEREAWPW